MCALCLSSPYGCACACVYTAASAAVGSVAAHVAGADVGGAVCCVPEVPSLPGVDGAGGVVADGLVADGLACVNGGLPLCAGALVG